MWQSLLGDVEAGTVFSSMQSIGAKGLSSMTNFKVAGAVAIVAGQFCGVLNAICNGCVEKDSRASFLHMLRTGASRVKMAIYADGGWTDQ
mmetsp:Transcript_24930/g.55314  ORF Transcript_24930/g.55314 Transcript_24930/m.55314 type:complete len:90 (-) Transcript_24930:113-382(-)